MFLLKSKTSHKPASHSAQVLQQLKKSGTHGSFNYELARVGGLAWHRRITDLRKSGVNIQAVRINGGVYKYYFTQEETI